MDDTLLLRLKQRDRAAWQQLRHEHARRVEAVCRHILKDPTLAREAADDLWTDFLLEHVERVRHVEAIPSYLRLMAVRRCCRLRDQRARSEPVPPEQADGGATAEEQVIAATEVRDSLQRLTACIHKLRPNSRRVLRLRFHNEMTQEEIGEALGFTKQYAGRVVAKCIEALRKCMERA